MKSRRWVILMMLLAGAAGAADLGGTWTGSMVMNDGTRGGAYVRLKQSGSVITGTQGPSADHQFPISSGRVEGNLVTIEARPGPSVLRLTMTLEGDKLTGGVFEDDQQIGTVSLQKANP